MSGLHRRFRSWLSTFYVLGPADRLRVLRDIELPAGGRVDCLSYVRRAATADASASLVVDLWSRTRGAVKAEAVRAMCRDLEDVATWIDGVVEAVEMCHWVPVERIPLELRGNLVGASVTPDPNVDRLVLGGRRLRLWTGAEGGIEPYVPDVEAREPRRLAPLRRELAALAEGVSVQRRQSPRRKLRLDGQLDILGAHGEVLQSSAVTLRDLSLEGTSFVARDVPWAAAGTAPPSVRLSLPSGLGLACPLPGELVRPARRPGGIWGMRFDALTGDERRVLEGLLKA